MVLIVLLIVLLLVLGLVHLARLHLMLIVIGVSLFVNKSLRVLPAALVHVLSHSLAMVILALPEAVKVYESY